MNYKIYNADCLEKMKELAEDNVKVDLVLTDPPYGTIKGITNLKGWENTSTEWDEKINMDKALPLCDTLLREKGTLILFSQEPYTSYLRINSYYNLPFTYPLIWIKDHFCNNLGVNKAPVSYFEDINVFRKKYDSNSENPLRVYAQNLLKFIGLTYKEIEKIEGHRKLEHFFYRTSSLQFGLPTREMYDLLINKYNIKEFEGFLTYDEMLIINKQNKPIFNIPAGQNYKSNILSYPKDYTNLHPTQKPVLLLEDLIKTYSNENNTVLDFTMGSGSTGIACQNTNRDFIGIELDENYFNIAKKRLEENSKQTKLTSFKRGQTALI